MDAAEIKTVFEYLPKEAWTVIGSLVGAVIGGITGISSALLATSLANRGHNKRQNEQLDHDRKNKEAQRTYELKQGIYLAATEALMEGIGAIGRATVLEQDEPTLLKGYHAHAGTIGKVHMVGGDDVVQAVTVLSTQIPLAMMRLIPMRRALRMKLTELEQTEALIGSDQEYVSGGRAFIESQVATLRQEVLRNHLQLIDAVTDEAQRLRDLLDPAIVAVRAELGLELDLVAYRRVLAEQKEELLAGMAAVRAALGVADT